MSQIEILNYLKRVQKTIELILNSNEFHETVSKVSESIISCNNLNKITVIYGNGGSAADAQHFSA